MMKEYTKLFKSDIVKTTLLFTGGNFFNAGIALLTTIIIVRSLGPSEYGLFAVAYAVLGLVTQMTDFGLSTSLVRFVSLYNSQNKSDMAKKILKMVFKIRIIGGLIVLFLSILFAKHISILLFNDKVFTNLVIIAFVGGLGLSLFNYLLTMFQAEKKFNAMIKLSFIQKFAVLFIILLISKLNAFVAIAAYAIIPFLMFFVGIIIIPKGFLKIKCTMNDLFELFHFSKWIMISTLATMLIMKFDVFMLSALSNLEEVGYYASANQLAFVFPLITSSLTTTLLPTTSEYTSIDQIKNYMNKIFKIAPFVIILCIPILIFAKNIISLIYGPAFFGSIIVFQILLISFIIGIIINPISLIFYSMNKVHLLSIQNVAQLIINIILNLIFIPHYGAIGAATSTLLVRVFGLVYVAYATKKHLEV